MTSGEPLSGSRGAGLADLFRHVSAEKATLYRSVMEAFAAAKRQFRLHMRPDEVLAEGRWAAAAPGIENVQAALAQLTEWGNLESQPDTARVASISDFYRARFLYRLSQGGEAVEEALMTFERILRRRAELQTIALEDIANRLLTLRALADDAEPDAAKVHETLRDLARVFESLADNAQAFMAGIGRSIDTLFCGRNLPGLPVWHLDLSDHLPETGFAVRQFVCGSDGNKHKRNREQRSRD